MSANIHCKFDIWESKCFLGHIGYIRDWFIQSFQFIYKPSISAICFRHPLALWFSSKCFVSYFDKLQKVHKIMFHAALCQHWCQWGNLPVVRMAGSFYINCLSTNHRKNHKYASWIWNDPHIKIELVAAHKCDDRNQTIKLPQYASYTYALNHVWYTSRPVFDGGIQAYIM